MSDYDPTLCGCGPQMPFGSGCMSQWRKPKPNGTCATCGGWLPGEKPRPYFGKLAADYDARMADASETEGSR